MGYNHADAWRTLLRTHRNDIAAVKRTNGQLRMEQKLRELESEAWQG